MRKETKASGNKTLRKGFEKDLLEKAHCIVWFSLIMSSLCFVGSVIVSIYLETYAYMPNIILFGVICIICEICRVFIESML